MIIWNYGIIELLKKDVFYLDFFDTCARNVHVTHQVGGICRIKNKPTHVTGANGLKK